MGKAVFSTPAVMAHVIGVIDILIHNTRLNMICFAPAVITLSSSGAERYKAAVVGRVPREPGKRTGQSENLSESKKAAMPPTEKPDTRPSPANPVDRTIHFIYLNIN